MTRGFRGRRVAVGRFRPPREMRGQRRGDKTGQEEMRANRLTARLSPLLTAPSPRPTDPRTLEGYGIPHTPSGLANRPINPPASVGCRRGGRKTTPSGFSRKCAPHSTMLSRLFTSSYAHLIFGKGPMDRAVDRPQARQESCREHDHVFMCIVQVREAK